MTEQEAKNKSITIDRVTEALALACECIEKQMKETYNQALEDFSAKMKEVNLTNSFVLYCGNEIDLEEFMILASEEIKEQLIKQ